MENKKPFKQYKKKTAEKASKPAFQKAKSKETAQPSVPAEWLYLSDHEVSASEIKAALDPQMFEDVEIWKAAGVVEITLGEKTSMDIEETQLDLGDEVSNAFLADHQAKCLYLVTISPSAYERAKLAMEQILAGCGGLFCGDTEDFSPIVK